MKKFLKVLSILGLSIFLCIVTLMTIFIAGYIYVEDDLPQLPKNLSHINYRPPTEIYSNDGELLKTIGPRNLIRLNMIPREFQNAILAIEDRRFFISFSNSSSKPFFTSISSRNLAINFCATFLSS